MILSSLFDVKSLQTLTGLVVEEAMGRSLAGDLVVDESAHTVVRLLHLALQGKK